MNPREKDFRKKKELGRGAFGVVHLVTRVSDGAEFALKQSNLRGFKSADKLLEAETWMKLPPHRNIVRLYEHWLSTDEQYMFLLMELCGNNNLAKCIAGGELGNEVVKDLCRALLGALCVFEEHKIMHNDLKPDNIFLSEGFVPKIGDMGLAKFTSGRDSILRKATTGYPGGTPIFMSPEMVHRHDTAAKNVSDVPRRTISYQSDVYSLGALLWSLKMGRYPDTPGQVLQVDATVFRDKQLRDCLNDMLQRDADSRPRASKLKLKYFSSSAAPAGAVAVSTPGLFITFSHESGKYFSSYAAPAGAAAVSTPRLFGVRPSIEV